MGWASKRNGDLLALATDKFDIFLTADRNLSYQQDVSAFDIAVVVLVARSNNIDELRPLVPRVLEAFANAKRRAVTMVGAWDRIHEFMLKYRGALPGGSASGKVEYKHSIRKVFHEQLADYWQRDTRLKELKPAEFHEAQKSVKFSYDVPRPVQGTQKPW
jgi:hypothetical protein